MIVVRLEVSFEISLTWFSRHLSFLACPLVFCDLLPFRMSTVNEILFAATIANDDARMQPFAPALQPDVPAYATSRCVGAARCWYGFCKNRYKSFCAVYRFSWSCNPRRHGFFPVTAAQVAAAPPLEPALEQLFRRAQVSEEIIGISPRYPGS